MARPQKYKAEYADQVYKLCLLGATDKELADFFEISEALLNTWKREHRPFLESMRKGKEIADAEVASKLFHRATGYEHEDTHVSSYEGKVTLTSLVKHYPPDTPAASLWLRNRQPQKWRDKTDHELTGPNGGPIEVTRIERVIVDPANPNTAGVPPVPKA